MLDLFQEEHEIPLDIAASYFVGLRKFAGTEDPPDETGTLEGQFSVPVPQVLAILSELVQNEFKAVYAYMVYSNSIRTLSHHDAAEEFEGHMEDELEHANWLTRRMAVLGGGVSVPDIQPPPASTDPVQIIKILIRMEQEGIAGWRKLLDVCGENPMRVTVEDYLAQEQEHLDDLWQMLPQEDRGMVTPETKTAATTPNSVLPGATVDEAFGGFGRTTAEISKKKKERPEEDAMDRADRAKSEADRVGGRIMEAARTGQGVLHGTIQKKAGERVPDHVNAHWAALMEANDRGTGPESRRQIARDLINADVRDWQDTAAWVKRHPTANKVIGGGVGALGGAAFGAAMGGAFANRPGLGAGIGAGLGGAAGALLTPDAAKRQQMAEEHAAYAKMLEDPYEMDQALAHEARAHRQPATVFGKHAAEKSDNEAADAGRRRAIGNAASDFEKDRHHKKERLGDLIGRMAGAAAGGGGAYHAARGGQPVHRVGAAAAGALVGGALGARMGKSVGREFDEKKFEAKFRKSAARMGLLKNAAASNNDLLAIDPASNAAMPAQATSMPSYPYSSDASPVIQPDTAAMLQSEMAGAAAQAQQEADYFRQIAEQEKQRADGAEQQAQQAQQQAQEAQQQAEQTAQESQMVRSQAVTSAQTANSIAAQAQQAQLQAMTDAIQSKQDATQRTFTHETMKQQIAEVMSSEAGAPPVQIPVGAQAAPPQQDPNMAVDPSQQAQDPAQAPAEQTQQQAPQQAKQAGIQDILARVSSPEAREALVHSAGRAAPWAAAGAVLGAGNAALMRGRNSQASQAVVDKLEAKENGGFFHAIALAKARMYNEINQAADAHPGMAMGASAVLGAGALGAVGPEVLDAGKYIAGKIRRS